MSSHAPKLLSLRSEYFPLVLPHASFSSLFFLFSGLSVSHSLVETRVSDFVKVFAAVLRRSDSHRSAAPFVRLCMPSRRIARLFFERSILRSPSPVRAESLPAWIGGMPRGFAALSCESYSEEEYRFMA